MNDDLASYFPNSPLPPGSKQPVRGGVSEETEEMYFANEVIELPSPPSITKYSPNHTEQVKIGHAGLHIADTLRDSFQYGGDYLKDVDHYLGVLAALKLDAPTMVELRRLRGELGKTHNLDKHRKIICEDMRGLLLDLRAGRKA